MTVSGKMLAWLLLLSVLIWGTMASYIVRIASGYGWMSKSSSQEITWTQNAQ